MNLRCKKPRPLKREDRTYRDDRLFIIATEDTYAPEQYFTIFHNPRVHVRVLPTEGGHSAPDHVLERLDGFIDEYQMQEDDEFWLMLDTDHWVEANHVSSFTRVCSEAVGKGYDLAHSNPCFEIWLLLHVTDLDASDHFDRCADVEQRLREMLGSYNKRRIDCDHFSFDAAADAVARAERLDGCSNDRWPQKTGTHVYRLVKKLLPS